MAESLCSQCVALCCRYFALEIDRPKSAEEYDNIRWYLMHENIVVYIEKKKWYLGVLNKCKHLQPDNRCGTYETRPRICRDYNTDACDWHGGDYDYEVLFTSAEQLRLYYENKFNKPLVVGQTKPPKLKVKLNKDATLSLPILPAR